MKDQVVHFNMIMHSLSDPLVDGQTILRDIVKPGVPIAVKVDGPHVSFERNLSDLKGFEEFEGPMEVIAMAMHTVNCYLNAEYVSAICNSVGIGVSGENLPFREIVQVTGAQDAYLAAKKANPGFLYAILD